ncbi:alkaline phosphatase family protein [Arthrobacter rhombi]|uniref:alkaline phosphatase family protein n=1 Tax=Arthrobacter rhombi TaxID=71253 RepID=UPI003FD0E365
MKTKILLVGIDGLILKTALKTDVAPTIVELHGAGSFTEITMAAPTLSGPGWATLLTGSSHEQHGVTDNNFIGHRLLTRPDLLSRAFYQDQTTTTFAAAGWPPLVDPAGVGPIIHERREQQHAGRHRVIARDGETYGYPLVDAEIAAFAVDALHGKGPDVSFVYFCDADDAGHVYGANDVEYLNAIARIDAHVNRLHATLEQRVREHDESWLLVLTTDHGHMEEGGHGGGSPEECASFAIGVGLGRENPQWPGELEPEELAGRLLSERVE